MARGRWLSRMFKEALNADNDPHTFSKLLFAGCRWHAWYMHVHAEAPPGRSASSRAFNRRVGGAGQLSATTINHAVAKVCPKTARCVN